MVMLTVQEFVLAFTVGGAVIALWIAVRFPSFTPDSIRALFTVLAAAVLAPVVVLPLLPAAGAVVGAFVALFIVALPVLVFAFLAGAWTVLFLKNHLLPH